MCRLLSSDDNNNTDDKLDDTDDKAVVSLADDLSDLSTIDGSSRDSSSQLESREEALSASNETLNALGLEESLLRAEISHLLRENDSDDNTDDNTDDDDTDLKEFRRIEREIKLTELNKGLEAVRGQIEAKKLSQR